MPSLLVSFLFALLAAVGRGSNMGPKSGGQNLQPMERTLIASHRYLNIPVRTGATKRQMTVLIDGQAPRTFDIELGDKTPDWWAFMDIGPCRGKTIRVQAEGLSPDSKNLDAIDETEEIKGSDTLYKEALRPQFHFSPMRGWTNDPNGLVYYKGEYHLFFQHNPYGWAWGNMHWGHAVSRDLVHWQELPIALYPDEHGTIYSGSAVVDWNNTGGFQTGKEKALVAVFTSAGNPFTQSIAYSNDRGLTWTKYSGNPVLGHLIGENRDPKVFWYEPKKKWVMSLYLDGSRFGLFSSKDLKHWERMSEVTVAGTSECPNFFPIPLDGRKDRMKWVFYGGNGGYLVGSFDGEKFTPEAGPLSMESGNCWYASQVYNDIPEADGRTILIPWGTMATPGMPFNQMMGLPVELTLRTTGQGPRICANPVEELNSLRAPLFRMKNAALRPGENPLASCSGELLDLETTLSLGSAREIKLNLRGIEISYDRQSEELSCLDRKAKLAPIDGKIKLRILIDRTSADIFGNDGRLYMPMGMLFSASDRTLSLMSEGGEAVIDSLALCRMRSIWR